MGIIGLLNSLDSVIFTLLVIGLVLFCIWEKLVKYILLGKV